MMNFDRRAFLKTTSALAAGFALPVQGAEGRRRVAASDRINVGLIGCRSMGWDDLSALLRQGEAQCLALCDVDRNVLAKRAGELSALQSVKAEVYTDYRRVLDRKDIDAVLIATPDHWHCLQFVDACGAGKDVYVQKPLANSIAECDVMVAAAREHKRVVQVGQQQRSGVYWQELVAFLQSGGIGRIGRVQAWANFRYAVQAPPVPDATAAPEGVDYDAWLGPAPLRPFNPQRFHGSWRTAWAHGGGLMTDWGVHLLDIALWGKGVRGMPLKTHVCGGKYLFPDGGHETPDTLSVTYQFNDFVLTWENNAGVENGPFNKGYGLLFRGSEGYVVANRSGWDVYPNRGRGPVKTVKGDGWANRESVASHVANFVHCLKTRNPATACPVETGSLCAKYAHIGNIGARMGGGTLVYDDRAGTFNDATADAFLKPVYRAPWQFPRV